MFYANSETILNNDRFFSPYIVESYPHQKEKSFNNYLLQFSNSILEDFKQKSNETLSIY